jgi:DNA-directed RNA polymerase I, II, and III subunit RPABC2
MPGGITPLNNFANYNSAIANSDDSDSDSNSNETDASNNDDDDDDEIDSTIDPEAEIDDDDDIDEYDEAQLAENNDDIDAEYDPPNHQKMDTDGFRESILNNHAELVQHSYEEIEARCRITRNAAGAIDDPLHRTAPFITKFERARIIGERAKQLDANAEAFVDVPATVIDSYTIAMQEYANKKIPFIIKRPMPNGDVEYWKLADFEM